MLSCAMWQFFLVVFKGFLFVFGFQEFLDKIHHFAYGVYANLEGLIITKGARHIKPWYVLHKRHDASPFLSAWQNVVVETFSLVWHPLWEQIIYTCGDWNEHLWVFKSIFDCVFICGCTNLVEHLVAVKNSKALRLERFIQLLCHKTVFSACATFISVFERNKNMFSDLINFSWVIGLSWPTNITLGFSLIIFTIEYIAALLSWFWYAGSANLLLLTAASPANK
mgnify:CR=1 FL=1